VVHRINHGKVAALGAAADFFGRFQVLAYRVPGVSPTLDAEPADARSGALPALEKDTA
jgi:hypothetical protein